MTKTSAASIKARLQQKALEANLDVQVLHRLYAQERFLARLSLTPHSKNLILKGGLLVLAHGAPLTRPTQDMDFLGQRMNLQNPKDLHEMIMDVLCIELEDGLTWDADSIEIEDITKAADYPGKRIAFNGFLEKTRIRIKLDFGFGDLVEGGPIERTFPSQLGNTPVKILAYPLEVSLAEKFQAMVKLGPLNSRMKDFYDILKYTQLKNYLIADLQKAIKGTFTQRGTDWSEAEGFLKSKIGRDMNMQQLWGQYIRAAKLDALPEFENVIQKMQNFLAPVVSEKPNVSQWDCQLEKWNQ